MYTMDDHRRNAVQFPACSLDHVWRQRGNRTGHCAKCHETFEGISLFDAHQTVKDGKTICKDPRTEAIGGKTLRQVDGAWRGAPIGDAAWWGKSGSGNVAEGDDAQ
jgi:ribosomal protein L34E